MPGAARGWPPASRIVLLGQSQWAQAPGGWRAFSGAASWRAVVERRTEHDVRSGATQGRERPTLEKVAARAGVSRATVSRVVNGSPTVAPHIREAVMRAVQALGYVPNPAARSLVTQRTDSFALVVPEPTNRVFSDDQFFPGVIRGVSQELEAADKQLVLMLAGSPASHDRIERYAMARHVDGVMFASMHGADPLPGTLARMGIPVRVQRPAARRRPGARTSSVDNVGGAAGWPSGTWWRPGARRIATIAGPQDMVAGIDRLAGYRAGAARRDRPLDRRGRRLHPRVRRGRPCASCSTDDPELDAVFVASDLMAARRPAGPAAGRPPGARRRRGGRLRRHRPGPLHRAAADHRPAADRRPGPRNGPDHAAALGRDARSNR